MIVNKNLLFLLFKILFNNLVFKTFHGPQKVLSTAVFLYFACLLPSIAFGVLNSDMTDDKISVPKAVASQCLGGIFFSIFAGQPLIVVMTTAPLTLYVKGKNVFYYKKI